MTLEIQALINHNQSTHTLQDSKKLQETIEKLERKQNNETRNFRNRNDR